MNTKIEKGMRLIAAAVMCTVIASGQTSHDSVEKARVLLEAGKIQEAESVLRGELVKNPTAADAHFLLGYALFREQKAKESLAEFTAGATFRRPRADELKIVAADYVMLSDFSDADKWFSQVVVETPNDADAWYLLGRTKYSESEFQAAIAAFEHSLALRPKYIAAENNIGLCWKELNDHEKARAAFQTAIDWQGSVPTDAQPFLNLGTLLADDRKNEETLPYLTKAAALAPKNAAVHEELGKVYLAMNKLSEAQAELEQAVALAPDASALHYKLGQVLRREGLQDQAQQEFAICEKLNGTHSSTKTPNPPSPHLVGPN